jgi:hypothetical protein
MSRKPRYNYRMCSIKMVIVTSTSEKPVVRPLTFSNTAWITVSTCGCEGTGISLRGSFRSVLFYRIGQLHHVNFVCRRWVRAQEPAWRVYYAVRTRTITVSHLLVCLWARLFLLLDIFKHMGGILLWELVEFGRLRLLFVGLRQGILKQLGKSYVLAGGPSRNTAT